MYRPRSCKELDTTEQLSLFHRTKVEVPHPTPGTTLIPKKRSDAPTSDWFWSRHEPVWPTRDKGVWKEGF